MQATLQTKDWEVRFGGNGAFSAQWYLGTKEGAEEYAAKCRADGHDVAVVPA